MGVSAPVLNEPDGHRVAIEFPVARLNGGDDDEDGVWDPEDGEEHEANQDHAKDNADEVGPGRGARFSDFLAAAKELLNAARLVNSTAGRLWLDIMTIEIGQVEAIFRYPVKSMAGERLEVAHLGWHGIDGDRRLALRRTQERNDFPWLTATTLPDLLLFTPFRHGDGVQGDLPTHVRTPEGKELEVFDPELAAEIERHHGAPVQMTHLRNGIFDDASVSVIATDTVGEIGRLTGTAPDVRRFRPNIVVRLLRPNPFEEDKWLGGVLSFGEPGEGPRVSVTTRDVRCSMVNFDPDSGHSAPEVMKAIVRANQNNAGIYGTVIRTGRLATGQTIRLQELAEE